MPVILSAPGSRLPPLHSRISAALFPAVSQATFPPKYEWKHFDDCVCALSIIHSFRRHCGFASPLRNAFPTSRPRFRNVQAPKAARKSRKKARALPKRSNFPLRLGFSPPPLSQNSLPLALSRALVHSRSPANRGAKHGSITGHILSSSPGLDDGSSFPMIQSIPKKCPNIAVDIVVFFLTQNPVFNRTVSVSRGHRQIVWLSHSQL